MNKELKILLRHQLSIEKELVELIEECFKEIFKDEAEEMLLNLYNTLENFEEYGCVQSLCYHLKQYEKLLEQKKLEEKTDKNLP